MQVLLFQTKTEKKCHNTSMMTRTAITLPLTSRINDVVLQIYVISNQVSALLLQLLITLLAGVFLVFLRVPPKVLVVLQHNTPYFGIVTSFKSLPLTKSWKLSFSKLDIAVHLVRFCIKVAVYYRKKLSGILLAH